MGKEIKPAFSLKYIGIILLTALISSLVTFLFQNLIEKEKTNKVLLSLNGGYNELNDKDINDEVINIKYSLKNDTSEVKGFYRKYIEIRNVGSKGIENIKCKVTCKNKNIILIANPKVEYCPSNNGKIDYKVMKISNYENIIELPLLNSNESLSFIYEAYSKIKVHQLDIDASIRKKDLEVLKIDMLVEKGKLSDKVARITFWIITLSIMLVITLITKLFARSWTKYPEIRAAHNDNFWKYLWLG